MLLTIKEVAHRLKVSLSKAYALVSRGEIVCYRIGSCKRVKESDLDEFLERNRNDFSRLPVRRGQHF